MPLVHALFQVPLLLRSVVISTSPVLNPILGLSPFSSMCSLILSSSDVIFCPSKFPFTTRMQQSTTLQLRLTRCRVSLIIFCRLSPGLLLIDEKGEIVSDCIGYRKFWFGIHVVLLIYLDYDWCNWNQNYMLTFHCLVYQWFYWTWFMIFYLQPLIKLICWERENSLLIYFLSSPQSDLHHQNGS